MQSIVMIFCRLFSIDNSCRFLNFYHYYAQLSRYFCLTVIMIKDFIPTVVILGVICNLRIFSLWNYGVKAACYWIDYVKKYFMHLKFHIIRAEVFFSSFTYHMNDLLGVWEIHASSNLLMKDFLKRQHWTALGLYNMYSMYSCITWVQLLQPH